VIPAPERGKVVKFPGYRPHRRAPAILRLESAKDLLVLGIPIADVRPNPKPVKLAGRTAFFYRFG